MDGNSVSITTDGFIFDSLINQVIHAYLDSYASGSNVKRSRTDTTNNNNNTTELPVSGFYVPLIPSLATQGCTSLVYAADQKLYAFDNNGTPLGTVPYGGTSTEATEAASAAIAALTAANTQTINSINSKENSSSSSGVQVTNPASIMFNTLSTLPPQLQQLMLATAAAAAASTSASLRPPLLFPGLGGMGGLPSLGTGLPVLPTGFPLLSSTTANALNPLHSGSSLHFNPSSSSLSLPPALPK